MQNSTEEQLIFNASQTETEKEESVEDSRILSSLCSSDLLDQEYWHCHTCCGETTSSGDNDDKNKKKLKECRIQVCYPNLRIKYFEMFCLFLEDLWAIKGSGGAMCPGENVNCQKGCN